MIFYQNHIRLFVDFFLYIYKNANFYLNKINFIYKTYFVPYKNLNHIKKNELNSEKIDSKPYFKKKLISLKNFQNHTETIYYSTLLKYRFENDNI